MCAMCHEMCLDLNLPACSQLELLCIAQLLHAYRHAHMQSSTVQAVHIILHNTCNDKLNEKARPIILVCVQSTHAHTTIMLAVCNVAHSAAHPLLQHNVSSNSASAHVLLVALKSERE